MARVHTAKAGKDYPKQGIKRGDTYYHWTFFRQPRQISKTPPRPSQLTNQGPLSSAYAAQEALEDAVAAAGCPQDLIDALNECAEAMDEPISEVEETISNLEEAFQGGCPALEEKNEQKDAFESFKTECEECVSEIENLDADEFKDEEEDKDKTVNGYDDLGTLGQGAMMDEARELASALSIGI